MFQKYSCLPGSVPSTDTHVSENKNTGLAGGRRGQRGQSREPRAGRQPVGEVRGRGTKWTREGMLAPARGCMRLARPNGGGANKLIFETFWASAQQGPKKRPATGPCGERPPQRDVRARRSAAPDLFAPLPHACRARCRQAGDEDVRCSRSRV